MKKTAYIACVLTATIPAESSKAYELVTHGLLTQNAYERSVLSQDLELLKSLGLDPSNPNPFGEAYYEVLGTEVRERNQNDFERRKMPNDGRDFLTIQGWLMRGAIREDDYATAFGVWIAPNPQADPDQPQAFWRVVNHFFDPVNNRPLTLSPQAAPLFTLATGESNFRAAPNWALGAQDAFAVAPSADPNRRNHYTVVDAREAMYRALTGRNKDNVEIAKTQADRNKYWATAFRALGDVVHLVEDMAQPQHTRNDAHSGVPGYGHESVYEKYIEARATGATSYKIDGKAVDASPLNYGNSANTYPIPRFQKYSDYWSTREGVAGKGLADYSNRGFFSFGQNLGNNDYALPSNNAEHYTKESTAIAGLVPGNAFVEVQFLRGNVDDTLLSASANIRVTTESVWDYFMGEKRTYSLNRFNYDDMADQLIPRAVAYSAGLIDYFFRGRLAAEDASFSEMGITLRVKNAIDTKKYPYLVNEIMRSGGKLTIAYEYDLNGERVLGALDPVVLTQDLAPGQSSNNIFTFTVPALPDGAINAKYRLVFRGRLGQETDAVFAGEFVPVSGFIVQPNYVSEDGIGGSRNIYRTQGNWELSPNSDLAAGNADWKGWYVDGKPTKVLSWRGPTSRYFADYRHIRGYPYLIVPFEVQIYQDGKVFSIAPAPVMGAAVMKDDNGQAWLVTICLEGSSEVVYRRPNVKNETAALYDPINAPDGWREVGRRNSVPGEEPTGVSWFFNGSGTEAQTMREWKNPAQQNPPTDLHRLKMVVRNGVAEFQNLGNLPGYTGQRVCSDSYDADDSGSSNSTSTLTGEYIIAVDYKNDEEVLARVAVETSSSASSAQTIVKDSNNAVISRAGSVEYTSTHIEKLRWGGPDLVTFSNTQTSQASWSSGQDTSTYSEQNKNSYENAEITYFLDLRYDLYSHYVWGWDTETTRNRTNGSVATSGTGAFTESNRLLSNLGPEIVWFSKRETYTPQQGGSEAYVWRCWSGSNGPLGPYNGNNFGWMNNLKLGGGLWAVDTAGNLLVSQRYYSVGGYEEPGTFNFLTGTDPATVVPGEQSGLEPSYFPGGVIH